MIKNRQAGLTLAEVIVVVAVISVLAALLMPVLARAKSRAKRTVCLNNLKQINQGLRMYCDEHNDKLTATSTLNFINYKEAMKSYVGLKGASSAEDKLFACPADTFYYDETAITFVPRARHEQSVYDFSSYAFNGLNLLTNFPAHRFGVDLPGIAGVPLSAVKDPSKTVLVTEAAAFLPYSWHDAIKPAPGAIPVFNDSKDMVSFVDGHVDYIKIFWDPGLRYPDGSASLAAYYDPPAGYDYKWSGN